MYDSCYVTTDTDEILQIEAEHEFGHDPEEARNPYKSFTQMFCLHERYLLGDPISDLGYSDIPGMLRAMVKELEIPVSAIGDFFMHPERKKTVGAYLEFNEGDGMWYFRVLSPEGPEVGKAKKIEDLEDDMISCLRPEYIETISNGRLVYRDIYLYDHSGLTINTIGLTDKWDSGQIGVIWTTLDKIKQACDVKGCKTRDELREYALNTLDNAILLYDKYLRGDIYRVQISRYDPEVGDPEDEDAWETTDCIEGYVLTSDDYPADEVAKKYEGKKTNTMPPGAYVLRREWLNKEEGEPREANDGNVWTQTSAATPEPGKYTVLYAADGEICMTMGKFADGKWTDAVSGKELSSVIGWKNT